jgi:hypothetical protein
VSVDLGWRFVLLQPEHRFREAHERLRERRLLLRSARATLSGQEMQILRKRPVTRASDFMAPG